MTRNLQLLSSSKTKTDNFLLKSGYDQVAIQKYHKTALEDWPYYQLKIVLSNHDSLFLLCRGTKQTS